MRGHADIMQLLINAGSEINVQDKVGYSQQNIDPVVAKCRASFSVLNLCLLDTRFAVDSDKDQTMQIVNF